jgi:hypothetical protein
VFAVLLGGADPTLSSWLHDIAQALATGEWIPRTVFGLVLATLSLGTFSRALRPHATPPAPPPALPLVGRTERRIVVDAVIALFALFLVLQATYLFGHRPAGVTYAEYVHRGFAELTVVATLSIALVVALYHGRTRAGLPWEGLILIAQVECLVGSALHRLSLYEAAYGYTALRLWAGAYMLYVGAALALVAWALCTSGAVDGAALVRRTLALGALTFAAMAFGNADAWAVERDIDRYRATDRLDVSILTGAPLDAVPSAIAATAALPPACARHVRNVLGARAWHDARPTGWYEWNARRERGAHALLALTGEGSADGSVAMCTMPNP